MQLIKICIITSQYGHLWSGLGTYATNLINSLAENNHEVTVVCPKVIKEKIHPLVRIIEIPEMKFKPILGNWFLTAYYFNKKMQELVREETFHVIHFSDARNSLFCKLQNIPVIGTMHDYYAIEALWNPLSYKKYYRDWFKRWLFYNFTKVMEKRALKRLTCIIANSFYVEESLQRVYNLSNVEVINYGISFDYTINNEEDLRRLDGSPSILFVGGNFQRKGLTVLIKAIREIKDLFSNISVYVIGKDANEEKIKRFCKEMDVADNFFFLGLKDNKEVRRFYKKVDIFVMPSLIEGFGLVFLESMASGIPVIGGDVGGTREFIKDGFNGFLVKPGDHQDLSKKIQTLVEDNRYREKFIENGYETVKRFSVKRMAEETVELYEKVNQPRDYKEL